MTGVSEGKRNYCLDLVKGIACVFVVFMHCEFPGNTGIVVQTISRFSVPFFFMVSGFFAKKSDGTVVWGKKIRHIASLALVASVLYLILTPIWGGFITAPTPLRVAIWVGFNEPFYISGHLWFLFALLYDYILFALLDKLRLTKYVPIFVCAATLLYIFCAQGAVLVGLYIPRIIYRSFILEGLAFFGAGFWLRDNYKKINLSDAALVVIFIVSTLLCIAERAFFKRDFGVNISTFVQVFALFMFCVSHPDSGKNNPLTKFGSDYSLWIYILHPAIWHILKKIIFAFDLSDNTVVQYLLPIAVVVLTFAVSTIPVCFTSMIKKKKRG